MRYFDTFTGIGGFTKAIEQAYEKTNNQKPVCVGYSEVDKYADSIYKKQYPNHTNYGDIKKIKEEELPDFDLLVGGFPCQPFSIAGKRGGFADTRGTLFADLARILRAKKPRLFVFENVKGLCSHDGGSTFKTIIATFTELGYDCQWQVLNSKSWIPQNRERVFIVGHLRGTGGSKVFPFGYHEGLLDKAVESGESQSQAQVASTIRTKQGSRADDNFVVVGTLRTHKDGNGFREMKSGVSPTIPARAREDGSGQPIVAIRRKTIRIPEATKKGYAEASVGQIVNLSVLGSKTRRGRVSDIANTIDTGMQQYTITEDMEIRRLTPRECERLQGFPDDWTQYGIDQGSESLAGGVRVISDTQRYKTLGNAVTVDVVQAIIERLI